MAVVSAVLGALAKEAVLAVVLLWLLPQLGIRLPLGLTIGVLVAAAAWAALTYGPIRGVLRKEAPSPAEAMVGMRGTALTQLAPEGLVRIRGETWSAVSSNGVVEPGHGVTVLLVKGLKLIVRKEEQKT